MLNNSNFDSLAATRFPRLGPTVAARRAPLVSHTHGTRLSYDGRQSTEFNFGEDA